MTSGKSKQPHKSGRHIPAWSPQVGSRIAEVIDKLGGLRAAAPIAGVTDEQLARWRDGKSKPNLFGIAALAEAAGIDLNWIISGLEQKPDDHGLEIEKPTNIASGLDEYLLGLIFDGISRISRDDNLRLPPIELGRLSGRVLSDLMAAYDNPDDRRVGLKVALQQLRRELLTPPANGDSGKRSA